MEQENIEEYLKLQEFELDGFYKDNIKYIKKINDSQALIVSIDKNNNSINHIWYFDISPDDDWNTIHLKTIQTLEKLKQLILVIF